jgi:hypothetical protein
MIGTMRDYQLAKQLYDQDRPLDALKVIDRVLEFPAGSDAAARLTSLMTAIFAQAEEGGPGLVSTVADLGDGKQEMRIDPMAQKLVPVALGKFPLLAEILCLRAKACVEYMQAAGDRPAVATAVENTDLVMRIIELRSAKTGEGAMKALLEVAFPDNMAADLLALAAQPLLLLKKFDHGSRLLRDALELKPGHRVVMALADMFRKQHGIELDLGNAPTMPGAPAPAEAAPAGEGAASPGPADTGAAAPAPAAPAAPAEDEGGDGCGLFLLLLATFAVATLLGRAGAWIVRP